MLKKKRIIPIIAGLAIIIIIATIIIPIIANKSNSAKIVTSSQLEKAVNISDLSTAEFVYNGIAEKYKDDNPEKEKYNIKYDASVKVGINMNDIDFNIDNSNKTITPILPEIKINSISVDESSLSYIPKNPDMELNEILDCCQIDAQNEASNTDELYDTAKENLQTVVEALLKPITDTKGYKIKWGLTRGDLYMKNTKFTCVILITLLSINCLFGCGSQKQKPDFSSIKSVCELSTLKCYYHNVATYEKNAHGLLKVFGSGYKKIWIEYSGIVNLGIDINKVDISEPDTNNVITIKIPDAEVQSTSLDKSTLSEPLTDKGVFTKITTEEKTEALSSAQQNMKETAQKDTSLLAQAKEHAKLILQGYINNLGEEFNDEYTIKWVDVSE